MAKEDNKEAQVVPKVERKYIDVDTSYANVLKYDKEGHTLVFLSKPELFLVLSLDQLNELSASTRKIYKFAKSDYDKSKGMFKDDLLSLIGAEEVYGTAADQLEVELDGSEDYVLKWVSPTKVRNQIVTGWVVVTDEVKSQRGLRVEGYHMIGKNELVLMKTSKENYAKLRAAQDSNYSDMITIQQDTIKDAAERAGVKHTAEFGSEMLTF
jgi:hypothetical protein